MANANLFQQYLQPVRSMTDYAADLDKAEGTQLALQGQRRQNEIAALTADQTRQTMASSAEDRNALQRLAATWGADTSIDQRVASLRNSGRPALMQQADTLEKQGLEKQKTGAEVSAKNADAIASAIKNSRLGLEGISTPEQYMAWHEANHRDPVLGPYLESRGITADQARDRITKALSQPGGFAKMLNESKLGAEKAYDNLLEEAKQAETVRNNKEQTATQRRGQDLTASTAAAGSTQASSSKTLTEGQAKANAFGSRMTDSRAVIDELERRGVMNRGKIKATAEGIGRVAGLGTDSMGGTLSDIAGTATNWTQSEDQQRYEGAKRNWIAANLRKESGAVIGPGEYRDADNQYFPQPSDDKKTIEDKRRRRMIAERTMLEEVPKSRVTVSDGVIDFGSLK